MPAPSAGATAWTATGGFLRPGLVTQPGEHVLAHGAQRVHAPELLENRERPWQLRAELRAERGAGLLRIVGEGGYGEALVKFLVSQLLYFWQDRPLARLWASDGREERAAFYGRLDAPAVEVDRVPHQRRTALGVGVDVGGVTARIVIA